MGFFVGFVMFICSYLILGPIIMSLYNSYQLNKKNTPNNGLLIALGLIGLYILIWIISLNVYFFAEHIAWLVVGAITGFILSLVTFYNNKDKTLADIEKNSSESAKKYSEDKYLYPEILGGILMNGIDYISDRNPIPYICQIMQNFDKERVESVINEFKPNLNIKFKNPIDQKMEVTPLDLMAILQKEEMFYYLLDKGMVSANYHQLAMLLISENAFDMLNMLLISRKFDINTSLPEAVAILNEKDEGYEYNLLDMAISLGVDEKIVLLLKLNGAMSLMALKNEERYLDVKSRCRNLYAGEIAEFSIAEITGLAINLQMIKQNLPYEIFRLALNKYNEYKKQTERKNYNREQFINQMMKIQEEFEQIIGKKINPDGTI